MTKKKSTKQALLMSVLSLVLCISMLVGSTFAWFTDTVTSGNNNIAAGNLDIELEYYNGSNWVNVKDATDLFTGNLWEPGHTEIVYLRLTNKGSLAVKYEMGVNIVSETGSTNVNEKSFKLSDYIYFDVIEDKTPSYASREAALADVTEAEPIKNGYAKDGIMTEKDETLNLALVVYMPESVGNEANYKTGAAVPTIELGVNVLATQYTYESDSFGIDYDEDAVYYDTLVTNADELYAAVASATGDIVIAIDGNIVLNKALSKSGLDSIKFVAYDEDASINQATYNMHFAGAKVTFEGLTLTHGEKVYGNGGQTSTAFAVWDAAEVNYIDCVFNRSVGTIHASLHNFIGCTFNGVENPDNSKSEYPLYICDGENYNVVDCVFNCTNRGAILFYNDGGSGVDTLNISNTKFLGDIIADKTAVEIHNNAKTQVYNVNIKDVIVGDGIINGLYRIKLANVGEVNVNVDGVTKAATASNASKLHDAIKNAAEGDTIYLNNNIDLGASQLALEKNVIVDLNDKTISADYGWGIVSLKNGVSIKNGTIDVKSNVAAIRAFNVGSIENVTINIEPKATEKVATAIAVQNGGYVGTIKNVTITGATQGIELLKGAKVERIENVDVQAVSNGSKEGIALLINAGNVGKVVNSNFNGEVYGARMMLNGEYTVALELDNCVVGGGTAGIYAHDEVGISNTTNCSLNLTYDAETIINGGLVWEFEDECKSVVTLNAPVVN